jgi:tetratricopeptide (TPR) repeat protein
MRLGYLLLSVALASLGLGACSKSKDACADAADRPVGTALLAFLSRSRAAHHRADASEERNDPKAAEAELAAIVAGPVPPCPNAAEVREVLADTRARLGDLKSRHGDFAGALADVEKGLTLVPDEGYFRGHLVEVRGLVEERHAKALAASGDLSGSKAAEDRALTAFQEAMRIQSAVIERAAPKP